MIIFLLPPSPPRHDKVFNLVRKSREACSVQQPSWICIVVCPFIHLFSDLPLSRARARFSTFSCILLCTILQSVWYASAAHDNNSPDKMYFSIKYIFIFIILMCTLCQYTYFALLLSFRIFKIWNRFCLCMKWQSSASVDCILLCDVVGTDASQASSSLR